MTAYGWACLEPTCPDHGTTTATKTGIDDASRHGAATGHSTTTAATEAGAQAIAARANTQVSAANRTPVRGKVGAQVKTTPAGAQTPKTGASPTVKESTDA